MTWSNINLIFLKELLDITRDRRTLISMIVIPLVGIPLIFILLGGVMSKQMEKLEEQRYTVFVIGADWEPVFFEKLKAEDGIDFQDFGSDEATAREMLEEGEIYGVLVLPEGGFSDSDRTAQVRLLIDRSKESGNIVSGKVKGALGELRREMSLQRLAKYDAPESVLTPFEWDIENVATGEQMSGMILGTMLPYIMILLTLQGGMYAAIDMTAGEKEKATLETLLVSAASRIDIVIGKFLTVMTVSIVSALITLFSLSMLMLYGISMIGGEAAADLSLSIDIGRILLAGLMMLPLAALFASLMLTICIFARSSREAQTYLIPLLFAAIIPAAMSMMPGSELSGGQAWVPVVNVSLVIKDILTGNTDPARIAITFFATALYAAVGLYITMKVFQREEVLFKV